MSTVASDPPYFAAFDSRFRTTCSTYVGSATTVGQPARHRHLEADTGPARLLRPHDVRDDALQEHRLLPELAIVLAEPVEGDDVLDQALEALGPRPRCPRTPRARPVVERAVRPRQELGPP
jgi:hypothetical protein